jgi:hypothetical protein
MMSQTVEEQLKLLLEKVDRILSLLEMQQPRRRLAGEKTTKKKAIPLTTEEIEVLQQRFERIFGTWDAGEELQAEKELESMGVQELRRFADANNLNVTSKTTKQKVMQLIAGRFRERRQLMRSHNKR